MSVAGSKSRLGVNAIRLMLSRAGRAAKASQEGRYLDYSTKVQGAAAPALCSTETMSGRIALVMLTDGGSKIGQSCEGRHALQSTEPSQLRAHL